MRWGDAVFALGVSSIVQATGCAGLLGVEDWAAGGSGGAGHGAGAATGGAAGSGAIGASGSGGESGGGGGVSGPCGGTSLFADDFEPGTSGAEWVTVPEGGSASIGEQDGALVVFLDGMAPCSAAMKSARFFDLTGDSVTVKVSEAPTSFSYTSAELVVGLDDANLLRIQDDSNVLYLEAVVGGTPVNVGSVQYNPQEHQYWRIREADGTVYWETSANGAIFDALGSRPTGALAPVSVVRIALRAASQGTEGSSSAVRFAEVNGGQPKGVLCKTGSFVDDFENPKRSAAWALTPEPYPCSEQQTSGNLLMTPAEDQSSICTYESASDFDLTDSSIRVELVQPLLASATSREVLRAMVDPTNRVEMYEKDGQLIAGYTVAGRDFYEPTPFDHSKHRHWRIRESAGTVFWEASDDVGMWTEIWKETPPLDLRRVQVVLGASADAPPPPGAARFDNLNLGP